MEFVGRLAGIQVLGTAFSFSFSPVDVRGVRILGAALPFLLWVPGAVLFSCDGDLAPGLVFFFLRFAPSAWRETAEYLTNMLGYEVE